MLTLGEYEALAKNAPGAPPLSSTLGAIERQYWRSLTHTAPPPVYGADVLGSLFGGHRARGWNVDKLGSQLLSRIGRIPGVNQAYLYCGMWRSFFALHKGTPSFRRCVPFHRVTASPLGLLAPLRRALTRCSFRSTAFTSSPRSSSAHPPPLSARLAEDADLGSTNFLWHGADKVWYGVGATQSPRVEASFIRCTVTFCANPANNLTCPLIYFNLKMTNRRSCTRAFRTRRASARSGFGTRITW